MIICSEILKTGLWHSRGQRFDPAYLHQVKSLETKVSRLFLFAVNYTIKSNTYPLPFVIHAEGGAALWEELYEEHFRELVAYGSRMCENRELAQDLAQETFIKALMNGESLESLPPNKRRATPMRRTMPLPASATHSQTALPRAFMMLWSSI